MIEIAERKQLFSGVNLRRYFTKSGPQYYQRHCSLQKLHRSSPVVDDFIIEMRIIVTNLQDETTPVDVTKDMTIDDLKRMIQELKNIPTDVQRYVYSGKWLRDGQKTFGDLDIPDGASVNLVLGMRGEEDEDSRERS